MKNIRPPVLHRLILLLITPRRFRDYVAGDLEESWSMKIGSGIPRREADRWYRREVRAAFLPSLLRRIAGGRSRTQDAGIPMGGGGVLDSIEGWVADLRLALRSLHRRPGFSLLAVITLSLGIGATSAMFSVVDRVLLRPLPYPASDQLFDIWNTYTSWKGHPILGAFWDHVELSWPEFEDLRRSQTSFESVGLFGNDQRTVHSGGHPERLVVGHASASLFPMLGLVPVLGRVFTRDEIGPGAPHLVVLSYPFWQDHLGADPAVLGTAQDIDGVAFTVIGVLPRGVHIRSLSAFSSGSDPHALWIPIGSTDLELSRGNHNYEAIGRLRAGVTPEQAQAESAAILSDPSRPGSRGIRIAHRKEELIGTSQGPLLLLLGAVFLLMLIACGNVALLLMRRAADRSREMATRLALGAGGGRILRQHLSEGLLLGVIGAFGGLLLSRAGLPALIRLAPPGMPLPDQVAIDPRVAFLTVVIGILTGIFFGLVPGVALGRRRIVEILKGSARTTTSDAGYQRFVVGVELAFALLLLVSSGLIVRSLVSLEGVDPGFRPDGLVSFRIALPIDRYSQARATRFFETLRDRLESLPFLSEVSGTSALPFSGRRGSSSFQIVGREVPDEAKKPEALRREVLPGFMRTLGIPLLQGRAIEEQDRPGSTQVVVISERMAEAFWPDESPIGQYIERANREWQIVGIVGDVRHDGLDQAPEATFYAPFAQDEERHELTLVARLFPGSPAPFSAMRGVISGLDPGLPVIENAFVSDLLRDSTAAERYRSLLMALFGSLASMLALVGVFGITARSVTSRSRELGIRMALGATRIRVVLHVVGQESVAIGLGLVAGVCVSLLTSRLIGRYLFGVGRFDIAVYSGTTLALLIAGLLASLVAARRAARLDPMVCIRAE